MTEAQTACTCPALDSPATSGRFRRWLIMGWRLFRRAPVRLFGLMLLLFAIEMLVQIVVPMIGIPLSKWVVGMLGGIYWLALYQLACGGRLQILAALGRIGNKWPALAALAIASLLIYLVQLVVGYLVLGPGAVDLLVFAQATGGTPTGPFQLGLIFASGVPLSTLVMFAAPLLLIDRYPLGAALLTSVRLCMRHAVPVTLLAAFTMLLVFLAPATWLLPILLLGPWLLCVGLAAYLDIGPQAGNSV